MPYILRILLTLNVLFLLQGTAVLAQPNATQRVADMQAGIRYNESIYLVSNYSAVNTNAEIREDLTVSELLRRSVEGFYFYLRHNDRNGSVEVRRPDGTFTDFRPVLDDIRSALFSFMGEAADAKYNDYEMSTLDHAYVKGFAELMEESYQVTEADKGCIIPADAFKKMQRLETVILPLSASSIKERAFHSCHALKSVTLPPYLQTIGTGAFSHCTSLTQMDFPSTLTGIGLYSRDGFVADTGDESLTFTGLEKIDFSRCKFQPNYGTDRSWTYVFKGCDNLKEIGLPSGVSNIDVIANANQQEMTIYVPASVKVLQISLNKPATLHFASPTPPNRGYYGTGFNNCTFYIPKGSMTAYYSAFGATNKYIEE